MKKYYLFLQTFVLIAMFGAVVASCDSDDDDSISKSDIVGVWDLVDIDGWIISNGYKQTLSSLDLDLDLRLEFRKDGKYVVYEYYDRRWNEVDRYAYTLSGNKLTMNEEVYEIVTLSKNALVLLYTWNEASESGKLTMKCKRIE